MFGPFLIGLALLQAVPASDYVPDIGWRDNDWARSFYERWFGNQLRAMGEPPFNEADLAGYRERFRLLVLPSFEPAYSYRIDVRQNGAAILRWSLLSGRGGYAPGHLVREGSRPLRAAELHALRQALADASLASLRRDAEEEVTANPQDAAICVDGTMLVFEHLTARGRDYVIRDCDYEDSLRRLMHVISRMKPRNRMN